MNNEGSVYIIQSITNKKYYIGSSENPFRRLNEHNKGKTTATRNKGPWIIKFIQKYPSIKTARQMEYKLKKLKRRNYIEDIIRDGYIKLHMGA